MAEKRMFGKKITSSDSFLEMPLSTQALYFHLNMNADDDGFLNNVKSIVRLVGAKDDDLKILVAKNYIIPFESGIVVIKHWRIHNYIQKDRYKNTEYKVEFSKLELINNEYQLKSTVNEIEENSVGHDLDTDCIQNGHEMDTQVRLDKIRDRLDKNNINIIYISLELPLNDGTQGKISQEEFDNWKETYPAIDVEQEIRKMISWSNANPKYKKTRKGYKRFINSWLSRAQDRARVGNKPYSPPSDDDYGSAI